MMLDCMEFCPDSFGEHDVKQLLEADSAFAVYIDRVDGIQRRFDEWLGDDYLARDGENQLDARRSYVADIRDRRNTACGAWKRFKESIEPKC